MHSGRANTPGSPFPCGAAGIRALPAGGRGRPPLPTTNYQLTNYLLTALTLLTPLTLLAATLQTAWWGDCYTNAVMSNAVESAATPGSADFARRRVYAPAYWAFLDGYAARSNAADNVWLADFPKTNVTRRLYLWDRFEASREALRRFRCGTNALWSTSARAAGEQAFSWNADPRLYVFTGNAACGWFPTFDALAASAAYPGATRRTRGLGLEAWQSVNLYEGMADGGTFGHRVWTDWTAVRPATTNTFDDILRSAYGTATNGANVGAITNSTRRLDAATWAAADQALGLYDRAYADAPAAAVTNLCHGVASASYRFAGTLATAVAGSGAGSYYLTATNAPVTWTLVATNVAAGATSATVELDAPRLRLGAETHAADYGAAITNGTIVEYYFEDDNEELLDVGAAYWTRKGETPPDEGYALAFAASRDYPDILSYYEDGELVDSLLADMREVAYAGTLTASGTVLFGYAWDAALDGFAVLDAQGGRWPCASERLKGVTAPVQRWFLASSAAVTNALGFYETIAFSTYSEGAWAPTRHWAGRLGYGYAALKYGAADGGSYASAWAAAGATLAARCRAYAGGDFETDPEDYLDVDADAAEDLLPTAVELGLYEKTSVEGGWTNGVGNVVVTYRKEDGAWKVDGRVYARTALDVRTTGASGAAARTRKPAVSVDTRVKRLVRADWDFPQVRRR